MRRWLSLLDTDRRAGSRQSLVLYVLFSPILLAVGLRLVLPMIEEPVLTVAVAAEVAEADRAALERGARVELLPDTAAVEARVLALDDVPGVVLGETGPEVLLEGNEADWIAQLPGLLLRSAHDPLPVRVETEELGRAGSQLRQILTALVSFSILLMGGVITGLMIVDEKEAGTLRALAVSPVRFHEYLSLKTTQAASLGWLLGLVVIGILTGGLPSATLLLVTLGALPAALLLGWLLAALANDQIVAAALLKTLLFFFTSVPIAGFFVTGGWRLPLLPMTNHWAIQALYQALAPDAPVPWRALGLSWLTGVPLLILLLPLLRRRLGFGSEGWLGVTPADATPPTPAPES